MSASLGAPGARDQLRTGMAYSDIRGLENLSADDPGALDAAAAQFESVFLDMWLKSMRDAGRVFGEGSYLSSADSELHQEMLDHQWAVHLAESGGIGLRGVIVEQLSAGRVRGQQADASGTHSVRERSVFRAAAVREAEPGPAGFVETRAGFKGRMFQSMHKFVTDLLPLVEQGVAGAGLSPLAVLAQGALETGWGRRVIHDAAGRPSHNLFGVKAHRWDGARVPVITLEHELGHMVRKEQTFRAYQDWPQAITDYVEFLAGNDRYRSAMAAQDPRAFADELQRAGYATDPDYAGKIKNILSRLERLMEAGL